jgi:hypothetical protein
MVLVLTVSSMTKSRAESVLATLTLEEKVRPATKDTSTITNIHCRSHYLLATTFGKLSPSLRRVSLHSK